MPSLSNTSETGTPDRESGLLRNGIWKRFRLKALLFYFALAGVLWLRFGPRSKDQIWYDGTEVTLLTVTQGPVSVCYPGRIWDRLLRLVSSEGKIAFADWQYQSPAPITNYYRQNRQRTTHSNTVVIWLQHYQRPGGPNGSAIFNMPGNDEWFKTIRAEVVDAQGIPWEMRPGSASYLPVGRRGIAAVSSWKFLAFPRRDRAVTFRIYHQEKNGHWDRMAEFKIRNPGPNPNVVWAPEPLPNTRQAGDLSVSLTELVSGLASSSLPGNRPYTRTLFDVKQNGQATTNWMPHLEAAFDATGNESDFQLMGSGITNGSVYFDTLANCLSPTETWKLRMNFTQQDGFKPEQVWTTPKLTVSHGLLDHAVMTTNLWGEQLQFECRPTGFTIKRTTPTPDRKLLVEQVVDQNGEVVRFAGGGGNDDGYDLQLVVAPETEWITITFALGDVRSMKFQAKPVNRGLHPILAFVETATKQPQ